MAEQDRLIGLGHAIAGTADAQSARFAAELGRVLAGVERSLLGLLTPQRRGLVGAVARLLTLRRELRQALVEAGYPRLVTRASLDAVARMAETVTGRGLVARAAGLGAVSAPRLRALARVLQADLLGLGETFATQVWRAAVFASYTRDPQAAIVAALAKQIDATRAQAQTLFDTQVSIIGRQIEAELQPSAPEQAYLYTGPIDGRVRDWCEQHLGLVMTRDRIEQLDNGQLPNPFLTGGGYNCRHVWLGVSDPDLVALANTGQRAPGYAERVAEVAA